MEKISIWSTVRAFMTESFNKVGEMIKSPPEGEKIKCPEELKDIWYTIINMENKGNQLILLRKYNDIMSFALGKDDKCPEL